MTQKRHPAQIGGEVPAKRGSRSFFGQPGFAQAFGDGRYDFRRVEPQCVSRVIRRCKPRVKFEHLRQRLMRFCWLPEETTSRHLDAQCGKIGWLLTQRAICPLDGALVLTLLERR
jgi:hypothetical protein